MLYPVTNSTPLVAIVNELPLAAELSRDVSNLRITLSELRGLRVNTFPDTHRDLVPMRVRMARDQFRSELDEVDQTLARYRDQLARERPACHRCRRHPAPLEPRWPAPAS